MNRTPSWRATSWPSTNPPIAGATTVAARRPRTCEASSGAEALDGPHLLQGQRTLEVLPAVEAAAENKMAFQERPSVPEDL